jgi:hypothetical protein
MRKITLFCLLFVIALFSVPAETIFVYIEKGDIPANNLTKDSAFLINRVEDGIVDTLFENGHIVFSNNSGENQITDFEVLNQIAKSGGAAILISASVNLKITGDAMIISGEYRVYNLFTDKIIYRNSYAFNNAVQKNSFGIEEKLFLAGQSVGKQIEATL